MDAQKVDMYMLANQQNFPPEQAVVLREKLMAVDDSRYPMIAAVELKNPTTILLISIFLGGLGIDRFMLGDTGMGILKLLTGGVCGILTIIDWFTCQKRARELNFTKLMSLL